MRTLVIDTATKACSVALYDGDAVLASHYEVIGRGHAERLLPFISDLPDRGRADRVMVNVGPGSFTGIRVGVAAARALGMAWGAQVSGYGCLELVAAMARAQIGRAASVDIIMAGGHGEYFYQCFDNNGLASADAVSLAADTIITQGEAIAGDANAPVRAGTATRLDILPDAACWHLIASSSLLPASPVYGRAPDAKLPRGIAA
jgi:tRNA threonylcarbamoyladenosine biosynthesis protein TsaB